MNKRQGSQRSFTPSEDSEDHIDIPKLFKRALKFIQSIYFVVIYNLFSRALKKWKRKKKEEITSKSVLSEQRKTICTCYVKRFFAQLG